MNADQRHDPDELLALTREGREPGRGSLRVYLGMCPGVGKTCTMLEDARLQQREGADLVVGWVDTHGRADTAAHLTGLRVLPRGRIHYRDRYFEEFDLDAALASSAPILLVDELAHSNAPGSRHPKRWQDIEELLRSGRDVWTTVNIQHVESLRDAVMAITGVRVSETVPDRFLDRADEVRVIDILPEQLRERLVAGKIYQESQAGTAAQHFFQEGNLTALREMALRFAARKVDAEKRNYMRRNLIQGPWRTSERFLVAVGPSPHAEWLIRVACRIAQAHDASWVAVHIDSGVAPDEAGSQRLAANLSLARSLGAETMTTAAGDTVSGILRVAARENVTQIIAGKPGRRSWWSRLRVRSFADRLQHESGEIDILLVHPGNRVPLPAHRARASALRSLTFRDAALATGSLAGITLTGWLVEPLAGYRSVALLYLLGTALTGLAVSRGVVIGLAVCSGLAWNFFFTEPRLSFAILNPEDSILLLTSILVAAMIGHLTSRLRLNERSSRLGEERARALYQLTRVTAASRSLSESIRAALRQVETVFATRATLLVLAEENRIERLEGAPLSEKENSVCEWALQHAQAAGRFTGTLPEATVLALPLSVSGSTSAVLAVRPRDAQLASPILRDLLETFAVHFSVILEKHAHLRAREESILTERSRQFQRALLDHVSHEIKTPVAVIQTASEHLLHDAVPAAGSRELLEEIGEASRRLNRVFTQLVNLSRAEAGLILPSLEVCDARDLVEEAIERIPRAAVAVSGETFSFRTDPSILDTVLINLLQNAVQHGTGPVSVRISRAAGRARFDIANPGPPIPEAEAARVFERFTRGERAGAGGMGLGLAISREFVRLLDGTVTLEPSAAGRIVFRIEVPDQS